MQNYTLGRIAGAIIGFLGMIGAWIISYPNPVLYFLLISVVNKIGINPALVPKIQDPAINISLGFSFWLASLLFFSAAFLVLFSIGEIFDLLENS